MSDKRTLSAKRPKSDEEVVEAVGRMIQAIGRRCATADPDTAAYLRYLEIELDEAKHEAVRGWRETGYSDAQIGRELGVTKQAIQQRFPR